MAKGKFVNQLIELAEKAGLDMSDAARMQRANEQGFSYARASQKEDSPINNGVGYAMFAKSDKPMEAAEDLSRTYGGARWVARDDSAVDIKDIKKDIIRSIRSRGRNSEYGSTAAALTRTADPEDIINSAGFWDNRDLVSDVWEDVLEPKGIRSVKTQDGLIVFDDAGDIVRSVNAAFDPEKKYSGSLFAGALPAAIGIGSMLGGNNEAQAMPNPDLSANAKIQNAYSNPDNIESPENETAALFSMLAGKYNQARKNKLHPIADMLLPVGELPEDLWRKRAYGDKVGAMDYIKAGVGML